MSEDQRRAAERIELPKPIEAMLVDVPARIVEISLINCKVEHTGKVPMGSNVTLQFQFKGEKIRLKGKLTRSEMRPIGGKLSYVSAMQFADALEDAPAELRRLIAGLLSPQAQEEPPLPPSPPPPPPLKPPPATSKAAPPPAKAAPPKSKPAPLTSKPAPAQAKGPSSSSSAFGFEKLGVKPETDDVEEIEASAEVPAVRYIECSLAAGKWSVREVTEPRQPREGFTMIAPEDPAEIDQFCKTYEVADPETRRLIRVSFELAIARVNS